MEERIGFGPRFGAALIDMVLVVVASTLLGGVIGGLFGAAGGAAGGAMAGDPMDPNVPTAMLGGMGGMMMGSMIGFYLIGLLYSLVEAFTGASPGKMVLKLKIANADATRADLDTYLMRYAVKNVGSILGFLGAVTGVAILGTLSGLAGLVVFLGCFMVFGASKQALHDKIAKTAVYRVSSIRSAAQ